MKAIILLVAMMISIGALPAAGQQAAVKRLDGSTITPAKIDETVTRLMRAAEVTGVAVAIFNDGKPVYVKAYGVRDKEKNLPLTEDSVLYAASFTKVASAYMVMQLVDEGKLDLDKPVYQYLPKPLPEYENYKDLADDPRWKRITARMLMSHTAGFPNFRWLTDDRKLRIYFEPGSRYAYSGEGIELLQLVAEVAAKRPLDELMKERVFQPLGMTRTGMVWQERFENDYANSYDEYGRPLGAQKRNTADAAGSMNTTISDFARFVQAVMVGKGLRKETREQMLGPQIQILSKHQFPTLRNEATEENKAIRLSYGLGWGLYWAPVGKAFFKEGHLEGWGNYTVCFDKPKSGIVIMTNSSNGEGIFKDLLETVLADTYTPIEWEGYTPYDKLPPRKALKQHKEVTLTAELLAKYAGRYGEPPNLILTIRREGDHLSLQENDGPKLELFAQGERDFFTKVNDDELTFEADAQGRVTGLTLHVDGRDIPVKRVD